MIGSIWGPAPRPQQDPRRKYKWSAVGVGLLELYPKGNLHDQWEGVCEEVD